MSQNKAGYDSEKNSDFNRLRALFDEGAISRREFTTRLIALGVTAAAISEVTLGSEVAKAATPKRGGRARVATPQGGPDETIDPARFLNGSDFCRGQLFYSGLTRINESLEAEPELAESWEALPGANEWVFKLRKGVEFHDGRSLEGKDVVYSLLRLLDESVGSAAKPFMEGVQSVTAEDKHTVRFKLGGPDADFPIVLGLDHMKIVPEGYNDFSTAVGTGPFKVKEFKPGVRTVGTRNPNYFEEGKPYLDEAEWFQISDPLARVNALLAGDIDMMGELDAKSIRKVEEAPGVEVVNTKSGTHVNFVTMCDRDPTSNQDLRLAIKYLQDRERILKVIYNGYGAIGNDHPISPMDPFYCDELEQSSFDPDRAKHHLKKSGMEGTSIPLHASDAAGNGAVDIALTLQQNAAKIGFKIDVQREPADGYWSSTWMQKAFFMSGWNMRPTANIMLTLAYKSDASWNESAFKSSRLDEIILQARGELDKTKRKALYCEAQRLIHDDGGTILPVFVDFIDAMSTRVKGFRRVPLGQLGATQWPKFVWLDS